MNKPRGSLENILLSRRKKVFSGSSKALEDFTRFYPADLQYTNLFLPLSAEKLFRVQEEIYILGSFIDERIAFKAVHG